ncbi:hypothetical protein Taro_020546 [Colocasia esculenta]|uniref:Uncharacterized protein n=1 Tax=Colocasia esculenta TaxID=4460 RepID=A0A843UNY8_COLES|nr:hypothetical protein [Colocasia esculenta]
MVAVWVKDSGFRSRGTSPDFHTLFVLFLFGLKRRPVGCEEKASCDWMYDDVSTWMDRNGGSSGAPERRVRHHGIFQTMETKVRKRRRHACRAPPLGR